MVRLATMSRASMRLAKATSWGAVSSGAPADLRQVGAHGVAHLPGHPRFGSWRIAAAARLAAGAGRLVALDHVDPQVGEHGEQVVGLARRELRLAHDGRDLGAVKVVLLAALSDEPHDLVAERPGSVDLLVFAVIHERRDTPKPLTATQEEGGRAGLVRGRRDRRVR